VLRLSTSRIFLAAALLSGAARASMRVLSVTTNDEQVTLSAERGRTWKVDDPICIYRDGRELACGFVADSGADRVVMRVETREAKILVGESVDLQRQRTPAAIAAETASSSQARAFSVGLGVAAGFDYVFPMVDLEAAVARSFTVGLTPLYLDVHQLGSRVQAVGALAWLTYYDSRRAFRGLNASVGAGVYDLTVSNGAGSNTALPFAVAGTVGWRGRIVRRLAMDVGVAAGVQWVSPASLPAYGFSGVLPLVQLTVGYSF
jgi:hypothetical protein